MSCIKSLPELCRLGIARVGIRTLLLVLFTYVTQHTAVLLGNSSTLNKRGENPPRCNRTTPADFSLANPAVNAQTIFSFSVVMAFHEALTNRFSTPHEKPSQHKKRQAKTCRRPKYGTVGISLVPPQSTPAFAVRSPYGWPVCAHFVFCGSQNSLRCMENLSSTSCKSAPAVCEPKQSLHV